MSMSSGSRDFKLIDEIGCRFLEGSPGQPILRCIEDAEFVVEACLSGGVDRVLLCADNLPNEFFDLSSGAAGAILQKLLNYRIRLGVVCIPGAVRSSSRFRELIAEERHREYFHLFESRQAALEWLIRA